MDVCAIVKTDHCKYIEGAVDRDSKNIYVMLCKMKLEVHFCVALTKETLLDYT